jgi:hypothetical protein
MPLPGHTHVCSPGLEGGISFRKLQYDGKTNVKRKQNATVDFAIPLLNSAVRNPKTQLSAPAFSA